MTRRFTVEKFNPQDLAGTFGDAVEEITPQPALNQGEDALLNQIKTIGREFGIDDETLDSLRSVDDLYTGTIVAGMLITPSEVPEGEMKLGVIYDRGNESHSRSVEDVNHDYGLSLDEDEELIVLGAYDPETIGELDEFIVEFMVDEQNRLVLLSHYGPHHLLNTERFNIIQALATSYPSTAEYADNIVLTNGMDLYKDGSGIDRLQRILSISDEELDNLSEEDEEYITEFMATFNDCGFFADRQSAMMMNMADNAEGYYDNTKIIFKALNARLHVNQLIHEAQYHAGDTNE